MTAPPPPVPGAKTTPLGVVARFLLGAIFGPAACLAVASCALVGLANQLARVGKPSVARHVVEGLIALLLLGLAGVLLAMFTHWAFKKSAGSAPAYASGVMASFSLWSLIAGLEGQTAFMAGTIVVGIVLTVVALVSASKGIEAYAKKFRVGIGRRCAHCGYDLTATAEGQVCPECGGTLRYDEAAPKPGA